MRCAAPSRASSPRGGGRRRRRRGSRPPWTWSRASAAAPMSRRGARRPAAARIAPGAGESRFPYRAAPARVRCSNNSHPDHGMAAARAPSGKSFQALILELQRFWAGQGCVLLQPYDVEVGAGTFHPATTLRALGPKPWRAAYVQPSRRPTDGRYGENPNRLQHYYQLQVILKPAPANSQELYLQSLAALGIDASKHDIRFVEDDWESPTLGAWGPVSYTHLTLPTIYSV